MANQQLPQYYRKAIQDFSGGLNTKEDPLVIPINQFTQVDDALINTSLVLERAQGYTLDGSPFPDDPASYIRLLVNYRRGEAVDCLVVAGQDNNNANPTYKVDLKRTDGNGSYYYIGHTTGSAVFSASTSVSGVGTSWLSNLKAGDKIKNNVDADSAYTEIASVNSDVSLTLVSPYAGTASTPTAVAYTARIILQNTEYPRAIVFNNNLIITIATDSVMSYDSSSLNLINTAPRAHYIEAHKNRIFLAKTSSDPSSIYWSKALDETVWDGAAFEPIFPQDNGFITGIKSFADRLIVLKNNGNIYQVMGSFDQDEVGSPSFIGKIDTPNNMGEIFGDTAVVHDDNRLYFLTETGYYALDTRMFLEKVSWDINPTIQSLALKAVPAQAKSFSFTQNLDWNNNQNIDGLEVVNNRLQLYDNSFWRGNMIIEGGQGSCAVNHQKTAFYLSRASTGQFNVTEVRTVGNVTEVNALDTLPDFVNDGYVSGTGAYSCAVAPNGNFGIVYSGWYGPPYGYGAVYNEFDINTRSWKGAIGVCFISSSIGSTAVGLTYTNASFPVVALAKRNGSVSHTIRWNGVSFDAPVAIPSSSISGEVLVSIKTNSSTGNLGLALRSDASLKLFQSTDGGGSWSQLGTTYSFFINKSDNVVQLDYDKTSNSWYCAYKNSTTGFFETYDGSVANVIYSTNNFSFLRGYFRGNGTDNFARSVGTSCVYVFPEFGSSWNETSSVSTSGATGPNSLAVSGNVVAFTTWFGFDSVRQFRYSFVGEWLSNDLVDTTLSSWGNVDFVSFIGSNSTVDVELATSNLPNPSSFTPRTSGTLIDANSSNIYVKAKVIVRRGAPSMVSTQSGLTSLVLNYLGSGSSPIRPTGVIFDNEYYGSVAISPDSNNTRILLYDRNRAFSLQSRQVSVLERYQKKLYAGSSINGDVLVLNQGYSLAGNPYTTTVVTKEELLGSLELEKDINKAYVLFKIKPTGTFNFDYRLDNFKNPAGNPWISHTIDQTSDGIAEILIGNKARTIQFRIQTVTPDENIGIVGIVMLYGYLNLR